MKLKLLLSTALALLGAVLSVPARSCSLSVPWVQYINLMEIAGGRVDGLIWYRVFNILDFEGPGPVTVYAVRGGHRLAIARWQDGQECYFDRQGTATCQPDAALSGVRLEYLFDDWIEYANRREDLRRVYLPLIVEANGREYPLTLSSRPVRNTRALNKLRVARLASSCPTDNL